MPASGANSIATTVESWFNSMPTKSLCDATQVARKMKDAMLLGLFFCLPITAARPVDPRFFDIDGLAAQVGGIMEKELTFLQGSFGVDDWHQVFDMAYI